VLDEAIDRQRGCEEMRARIGTSIGWAADVNPMGYNLTHPQRLERRILSLLRSRSQPGARIASKQTRRISTSAERKAGYARRPGSGTPHPSGRSRP
jgi:hypothetical protein